MTDTLKSDLNVVISALLEAGLGLKSTHVAAVEKAIAELDRLEAEIKRLDPTTEPVQAAGDGAGAGLEHHPAWFTCNIEYGQPSYYFAPSGRTKSPYRTQREVKALLDIADDGTLAGVELVWGDLPPPPAPAEDGK